jgi:hypothetical protein
LRPGRKVQIIYSGLDPIDLNVIGTKVRIEPVAVQVADDGELTSFRPDRIVHFFTDYGARTVALGALRFR